MGTTVENLFTKALGAKRRGNFQEAFDYYKEAVELNRKSHSALVHLGKAAYLTNQMGVAGKCYLAATHLQLHSIARALEEDALPAELQVIYNGFPKELLETLPHKAAFILFIDQTIPHHIGHLLVDLNEEYVNANEHLKPYIEVYRAKVSEDGSYQIMINMNGLNEEQVKKVDHEFYIGIGRKMILDNVNWQALHVDEVLPLYF